MSEQKPPSSGRRPPYVRRDSSDKNPVVMAYRQKIDSIADTQLEELKELNRQLAKKVPTPTPPKRDPRREEEDDERKEDEIPVDVVELPPERPVRLRFDDPPAPEKKKP